MYTKFSDPKKQFFYSALFTAVWGLIAHGYAYFNLLYTHDSMFVLQSDVNWQISLGRFIQPLYYNFFRGNLYPPALVGLLSLCYITLAVFLVSQLLHAEDRLSVCLISAVMTTNLTVALVTATYINYLDIFMLSMLLSVLSVWVCRRFRYGFLPAAAILIVSLGLYQAYLQLAVFLFMILALRDLLIGVEFKKVLTDGFKAIGTLLIALVGYYLVLQIVLSATGIGLVDNYNGLQNVGKFNGIRDFLMIVLLAYRYVLFFFTQRNHDQALSLQIVNLLLIALSVFFLISVTVKRKIRGKKLVLLLVIVALMPFGMNAVYLIAHGMVHDLMIYSYFFAYILAYEIFRIWQSSRQERSAQPTNRVLRFVRQYAVPLLLCVVIFDNIVYSNQIYLKKDLEVQSTLSILTRVEDRMEQTEGYVMGETPVLLVGSLEASDYKIEQAGLMFDGTGLAYSFATTYIQTYYAYFTYVLHTPVNWLPSSDPLYQQLSDSDEVAAMLPFPHGDSVKMVNGVLVVKFSEPGNY